MALVTVAATALGGGAALALESKQDRRGDVIGNPRGDEANYDIVSSSYGRVGKKKLGHTVTVAGRLPDPSQSDAVGVPLLLIDAPRVASQVNHCDFFVGRAAGGGGLGVFECGDQTRRGGAKIERTSGGTVRYVFSRKSIRSPKQYRWAVAVRGRSGGTIVQHDRIPDLGFNRYQVK